jgi:hypothetical protein
VHETERKTEGKAEPVLRAADVLPPFDKDSGKPSARRQGNGTAAGEKRRGREGADSTGPHGPTAGREAQIPSFDLAESILAEQRRTTARRRKRPARATIERDNNVATMRPTYIDDLSSEEQAELQEVVAEIVARDIARLCSGWGEPAPARPAAG